MSGLNHQIDPSLHRLAVDCIACHVNGVELEQLGSMQYQWLAMHATRLVHDRFRATARQADFIEGQLGSIDLLARLLWRQVQYEAAEQMCVWHLAGRQNRLGDEHRDTLIATAHLGVLYFEQGKLGRGRGYVFAVAGRA